MHRDELLSKRSEQFLKMYRNMMIISTTLCFLLTAVAPIATGTQINTPVSPFEVRSPGWAYFWLYLIFVYCWIRYYQHANGLFSQLDAELKKEFLPLDVRIGRFGTLVTNVSDEIHDRHYEAKTEPSTEEDEITSWVHELVPAIEKIKSREGYQKIGVGVGSLEVQINDNFIELCATHKNGSILRAISRWDSSAALTVEPKYSNGYSFRMDTKRSQQPKKLRSELWSRRRSDPFWWELSAPHGVGFMVLVFSAIWLFWFVYGFILNFLGLTSCSMPSLLSMQATM